MEKRSTYTIVCEINGKGYLYELLGTKHSRSRIQIAGRDGMKSTKYSSSEIAGRDWMEHQVQQLGDSGPVAGVSGPDAEALHAVSGKVPRLTAASKHVCNYLAARRRGQPAVTPPSSRPAGSSPADELRGRGRSRGGLQGQPMFGAAL